MIRSGDTIVLQAGEVLQVQGPALPSYVPILRALTGERTYDGTYPKHWETSYTKKLVDRLKSRIGARMEASPLAVKVIELLEQYHRDLHIPYSQRDAARKEYAIARKIIADLSNELNELRAKMASVSRAVNK